MPLTFDEVHAVNCPVNQFEKLIVSSVVEKCLWTAASGRVKRQVTPLEGVRASTLKDKRTNLRSHSETIDSGSTVCVDAASKARISNNVINNSSAKQRYCAAVAFHGVGRTV